MIELDKVWMAEENPKNVTNSKMESVKVLIFLLMMTSGGWTKEICPKMCTCDVFEGYKRADCR